MADHSYFEFSCPCGKPYRKEQQETFYCGCGRLLVLDWSGGGEAEPQGCLNKEGQHEPTTTAEV